MPAGIGAVDQPAFSPARLVSDANSATDCELSIVIAPVPSANARLNRLLQRPADDAAIVIDEQVSMGRAVVPRE